jgi:hypothetical protein
MQRENVKTGRQREVLPIDRVYDGTIMNRVIARLGEYQAPPGR